VGRLEGMGPPAEVDSDSTTEMEGDHMAGMKGGGVDQAVLGQSTLVGPD
jgi:hypothetical protein